jgi:hypothetical protein
MEIVIKNGISYNHEECLFEPFKYLEFTSLNDTLVLLNFKLSKENDPRQSTGAGSTQKVLLFSPSNVLPLLLLLKTL